MANYIRFVINRLDEDSGRRKGIFQVLYELRDDGELNPEEEALFQQTLDWFDENLDVPRSLARSNKYQAKKVAMSWFKDKANEHIRQMRVLASIIAVHGIEVEVITSPRPGYIVHEDRYQVAAEPFKETRT